VRRFRRCCFTTFVWTTSGPVTRHEYLNARIPSNPWSIFRGKSARPILNLITSARDYAEELRYVEVRTANGQYGHEMERRELNDPPPTLPLHASCTVHGGDAWTLSRKPRRCEQEKTPEASSPKLLSAPEARVFSSTEPALKSSSLSTQRTAASITSTRLALPWGVQRTPLLDKKTKQGER